MRLGLIFGGRSGEHQVSVVSARSVARALDPGRYEVVPMAIDREGLWADPATAAEVLERSGDRTDQVMPFKGVSRLDPRLVNTPFDVVFPVLHGPFGEDGTVQGLLEVLGIPYVGSGVAASAVCMHKGLTKRLLDHAGLPTPAWVELQVEAWRTDPGAVAERALALGLPLFVKPARLGSSVGITRVTAPEELEPALERAFGFDREAVVEAGVDAREIEVSVLGNHRPRASVPGEVVPGHEFYTFEDKYLDDTCQLLAPAPLQTEQAEEARRLAVEAYTALGCEGMARVDLFLDRATGRFLVNEINTIPGFTSISMYPRLWDLTGLPYGRLLDRLVELALERHARAKRPAPGG